MKSYLCRQCGEATLVGTPLGAIRRTAAEAVREAHGLLSRLLRGRRARREAEEQASDAFLTVPYRYAVLPVACPHCGHRGARERRGRSRWWEPGLTYRD
ncbi:MAG: hypothetical protein ABI333_28125 [bacterium]